MNKELQTLKLIVAGRYSRTSNNIHNQQQTNIIDQQQSTIQRQKLQELKQIKKIIKDKYNTFIRWDFRQSLPHHMLKLYQSEKVKDDFNTQTSPRNSSSIINQSNNQKNNSKQMKKQNVAKVQSQKTHINKMPLINQQRKLNKPRKKKSQQKQSASEQIITAEMQAVKMDRRQRFKKIQNPMQFLKHYIQKQHYSPTSQQKNLIQKIILIQKSFQSQLSSLIQNKQPNLEQILESIYKLMNLAVDYNQLLFLSLTICLAADICFFLKDYPRSFYFYNQARIAGSYAHLDKLKIPSLLGMGRVCFQLHYWQESKRIFRKALQYAWRNNDQDIELQIYDWFGLILSQTGKVKQSMYYHQKYARKIIEPPMSPLKKISKQMLRDFDIHIQSLQDSNLDSLFLEYLHLPINKNYDPKVKKNENKIFQNYDQDGKSPRMNKQDHDFSKQSFLDVRIQLNNFLNIDYQFKTEIPDPDKPGSRQINKLFNKTKTGFDVSDGKKRQVTFQHSVQFNKIIRKKAQKPDIQKQLYKSLDQKVQQMLKDRLQPDWYQNMVSCIKKRRMEKVGTLKQRVRNSHLSYGKYPSQRRRSVLYSTQKINQSFNRTLLDWIDPVQ